MLCACPRLDKVSEPYRRGAVEGIATSRGVKIGGPQALMSMTDHTSTKPPDAVDELVTQLLECGGVLSQIIASMVEFQSSGRSSPDTAPIPEIAHSVIRSVLGDFETRFSKRDVKVAARIVHEATDAICSDLYVLGPELN